jgi:HSP20 family protein
LDAWERELARPAGQGDRVAVRVKEEAERFVVKALVPGLRLEELKLSLLERALTLSGERKAEPVEGYTPRRQERGAWRFNRTLELPDDVDAAQIEATLKDGVLTVVLPRVAPKLPRPIEVKLA